MKNILNWNSAKKPLSMLHGKLDDSLVLGLFGGFIGTLLMDLSNLFIYKAGKTETLYGHIAGGLLMAPWRTKQRDNFILGQLTHFVIGSLWGVPLFYLLKKTGKDHPGIKGLVMSAISLGSLIISIKIGLLKKFRRTRTFYSAIWNHLIYGFVATRMILWMAGSHVFQEKKKTQNLAAEQP